MECKCVNTWQLMEDKYIITPFQWGDDGFRAYVC